METNDLMNAPHVVVLQKKEGTLVFEFEGPGSFEKAHKFADKTALENLDSQVMVATRSRTITGPRYSNTDFRRLELEERAERELRRMLAVCVSMPHTYYDDGEACGTEHGIQIDFMRDSVDKIAAKLRALNEARLRADKKASVYPSCPKCKGLGKVKVVQGKAIVEAMCEGSISKDVADGEEQDVQESVEKLGPVEKTARGFEVLKFKDLYGAPCSLQASSLAEYEKPGTSAVWLGPDSANPMVLASQAHSLGVKTEERTGWVSFPIPPDVQLTTRMHLDRRMVSALIQHLQSWLENDSFAESLTSHKDPNVVRPSKTEHWSQETNPGDVFGVFGQSSGA